MNQPPVYPCYHKYCVVLWPDGVYELHDKWKWKCHVNTQKVKINGREYTMYHSFDVEPKMGHFNDGINVIGTKLHRFNSVESLRGPIALISEMHCWDALSLKSVFALNSTWRFELERKCRRIFVQLPLLILFSLSLTGGMIIGYYFKKRQ